MKAPPKHFEIRVRGLVQGVFFRASAQRKAVELGLTGTVRNEPDGSVLIHAEGPPRTLDDFVTWCRRGPAHARVERVEFMERDVRGFDGFVITG